MADFDASTPQLKLVKKLMDAYLSLDMEKITDVPKEAKISRVGRYKEIFAVVVKLEAIFHEVIEAPGKVVLHVTGVLTTIFGATLTYDSIVTYTIVEEDGELKIIHCKDFSDPRQRSALIAGTVKAAAERAA